MGISLFERIKRRLPKRHKAEVRLPLSWEEVDADGLRELLQAARQDVLDNLESLDEALRSPN